MTYDEWITQVSLLLKNKYGITTKDCADYTRLYDCFTDEMSPEEFVSWIAEKYDLQSIDGYLITPHSRRHQTLPSQPA